MSSLVNIGFLAAKKTGFLNFFNNHTYPQPHKTLFSILVSAKLGLPAEDALKTTLYASIFTNSTHAVFWTGLH